MTNATVSRADLSAALAFGIRAVERKTKIPVLANARLRAMNGGLQLITTDLDREIRAIVPGAVDSAFDVTLPARVLADAVKRSKAEYLAIDLSDDVARLDLEGATMGLATIAAADFPEFPGFAKDSETSFELMSDVLADAFGRVESFVSTEQTRYYLNGVYMHAPRNPNGAGHVLRVVATDGHRLGEWTGALPAGLESYGDGFPGFIVPHATVKDVVKLIGGKKPPQPVRVVIMGGTCDRPAYISFTCGNLEIRSKTIDGTFPDYQRVIPSQNDKTLTFNRAEFLAALESVSVVMSERGRAFKLSIEADDSTGDALLTLSVTNADGQSSQAVIEGRYSGAPMEIGFNAGYAATILESYKSQYVRMDLADAGSPVVITAGGPDGLRAVLMPMRI